MRIYDIVIPACWLTFFVVWAVLSLVGRGGKDQRRYSTGSRLLRLGLLVVLVLVVLNSDRLPLDAFRRMTDASAASGAAAAGAVLCVIGLAFAIWARVTLGRHWGMPMTLRATPELITQGPYAYVRHPIYTGVIAMMIGTTLVYPLGILWCAAMIPYFVFSARREERDMDKLFPGVYPQYKQRSKMLVPFVF